MSLSRLRQLFSPSDPTPEAPPAFAIPADTRVYAVGDIHGRAPLLKKLLTTIAKDARAHPKEKIIEVFLGDYIDRGMQSRDVLDLLIAAPPPGHERICLLGNHEDTMLKFLADPSILRGWANFGGYATLASYGIGVPPTMSPEHLAAHRDRLRQNLPQAHENFLRSLKLSYTIGDYFFVHAGILPGTALDQQKTDHLLWIRDPFLKHQGFFSHYIVHGHSPVTAPDIHINRANLDITNAAADSLCCLALEHTDRRVILVTNEND